MGLPKTVLDSDGASGPKYGQAEPMRVCIVTVAGYVHGFGGMQRHTSDLARGLAQAGHDVEVITARHPEGVSSTLHEGALWHFVDVRTRYDRLPMRHPSWLMRSAEEFERIHAEQPFDLVHSESTSALGLLRRNVHRRVPVVVKFHGNWLGLAKEALRRAQADRGAAVREAKHLVWLTGGHFLTWGTPYRFRVCEAMVPFPQQVVDTRRSHLLDPAKVHVVPNAVDTELFQPRPLAEARARLGLPAGFLFVATARLVGEKGIRYAIRALAALEGRRDELLVVVGDGPERPELEELSRGLGVARRVLFVGAKLPQEVAAYLNAADVYLLPTERDESGGPLALLEAMASGLPVVASARGTVPDVVDVPGENGVLVPPADVPALTDAMQALRDDRELGRRIGEAARRRIASDLTLERMVERTTLVYRIAAGRLGRELL